MTEPSSTRRSYDAVAERYAAELNNELDRKPIDRALLGALVDLTSEGVVADLGAGPGQVGAYVASLGRQVIALDLSPEMCAVARRINALPAAAADLTALALAGESLAAITCFYAVIHLDGPARERAYAEFARVLRQGGHALLAFHTADAHTGSGCSRDLDELMGETVDLTFRFLDPDEEMRLLRAAGLVLVARLDRAPHEGVEHASQRTYLLVRKLMQPR